MASIPGEDRFANAGAVLAQARLLVARYAECRAFCKGMPLGIIAVPELIGGTDFSLLIQTTEVTGT